MKVTFRVESTDGEGMWARAAMPIAPQVGMNVIAVKGDDFRTVDQIYWSAVNGIEVYVEDAQNPWDSAKLAKLGWTPE